MLTEKAIEYIIGPDLWGEGSIYNVTHSLLTSSAPLTHLGIVSDV